MTQEKTKKVPGTDVGLHALMAAALRHPALSREGIRELLADYEWHCITTLAELLNNVVPIEVSSQLYVAATASEQQRQQRKETPEDKQAMGGCLFALRKTLDTMVCDHLADRRYADNFTEYCLFRGGHCWRCGRRSHQGLKDGICPRCQALGWCCKDCGKRVTGSREAKKGVCEKCAIAQGIT